MRIVITKEKKVEKAGWFHQWVMSCDNPGSSMVMGLVEYHDGSVELHHFSDIMFLSPGQEDV